MDIEKKITDLVKEIETVKNDLKINGLLDELELNTFESCKINLLKLINKDTYSIPYTDDIKNLLKLLDSNSTSSNPTKHYIYKPLADQDKNKIDYIIVTEQYNVLLLKTINNKIVDIEYINTSKYVYKPEILDEAIQFIGKSAEKK